MIGQIRDEYKYMLDEAEREINDNKKLVYVAVSDINTGEILKSDMVEQKSVYTSQPDESFITQADFGKSCMIDITKGTHIVKSMLAQNNVASNIREVEYEVIHIGANIDVNNYIDVRISFPNGENYIVLSKKLLKGFQPDMPQCYLWVDEEEILRMSAAIVDAGLYQGAKLFMTKYIEPNIQEASIITYTPNVEILSLIEQDENIIERCSQKLNKEVRKELENRLAKSMSLDVSSVNWEIDDSVYNNIIEELSEGSNDDGIIEDITEDDYNDIDVTDEIDETDGTVETDNTDDLGPTWFLPELGRLGHNELLDSFMNREG